MEKCSDTILITVTRENLWTWRTTCPDVTLYIRDSTWLSLGSNPDFKSERSASKRLGHKAFRAHAMQAYRDSRSTAPLILNLGITWSRAINFTSRQLKGRFTIYGTTRYDTTKSEVHSHLPAMTDRIFSSNPNDSLCLFLSLPVGDRLL
jgi:hypothetical protein